MGGEIITELIDYGFQIELVLADSLYGESSQFIKILDKYKLSYIVSIRSNHGVWLPSDQRAEGVTRELGGRADNGFRSYTSLIKAAFMGGFTG